MPAVSEEEAAPLFWAGAELLPSPAGSLAGGRLCLAGQTHVHAVSQAGGPGGDHFIPRGQSGGDRDLVGGVQTDGHIGADGLSVLDHIHVGHAVLKKHGVAGDQHRAGGPVGGGGQLHRQAVGQVLGPVDDGLHLELPHLGVHHAADLGDGPLIGLAVVVDGHRLAGG